MGLRKLPKPKPVSAVEDLLQFLVIHLVWCDSVFADEKQRFYLFPGMNLSSISGCRPVSLFDTRHIPDSHVTPVNDDQSPEDALSDTFSDDDCTLVDGAERDDLLSDPGSPSNDKFNDCDDDTYVDTDMSGDVNDDICEIQWDNVSDLKIDAHDDSDGESDISSVTDDGYLAGNEETGTILWRHISFHVVRSPIPDRPNVLFAIVTLLHTKGEDRKPRM
jgi:hypothetical protein